MKTGERVAVGWTLESKASESQGWISKRPWCRSKDLVVGLWEKMSGCVSVWFEKVSKCRLADLNGMWSREGVADVDEVELEGGVR